MDLSRATLGQIAIAVRDVEEALGFYRDVLGLRFLFRPSRDLAFLDAGGVRLMLSTPEGHGQVGAASTLYFKVEDIEAHYAALLERGARGERAPHLLARMPDHVLWMAFLRDPDRNLVGLMEEKR